MRPPDAPRRSGIKPVVPWSIFSHDMPSENVCRPTFKARRNYFQTPLGRTAVHGSISARLDGTADEIINCAHEDGPWPDDSEAHMRFWLHIRFRGSLKTPDGASFGWSRRMNKALERTGRALAAGRTLQGTETTWAISKQQIQSSTVHSTGKSRFL